MKKSIVSHVELLLGVDDKEIGRRLGVSVGTVKRWKKEPPPYARFALAALATGVDPDAVFQEEDDCPPKNP